VCGQLASLTDSPKQRWVAVEECLCASFFVAASLLERVSRLPAKDRRDVSNRIRAFRAGGHETWLATLDGTATGPRSS
jgi:hypothetical protein